MEALKPCPFCGWEAEVFSITSTIVRCSNYQCVCRPEPFNCPGHRQEAIAAWNTRAPLASQETPSAIDNAACVSETIGNDVAVDYMLPDPRYAEIERLRGEAISAEERADVIHKQDALLAQLAEALKDAKALIDGELGGAEGETEVSIEQALAAYEAYREAK